MTADRTRVSACCRVGFASDLKKTCTWCPKEIPWARPRQAEFPTSMNAVSVASLRPNPTRARSARNASGLLAAVDVAVVGVAGVDRAGAPLSPHPIRIKHSEPRTVSQRRLAIESVSPRLIIGVRPNARTLGHLRPPGCSGDGAFGIVRDRRRVRPPRMNASPRMGRAACADAEKLGAPVGHGEVDRSPGCCLKSGSAPPSVTVLGPAGTTGRWHSCRVGS